MPMLTMHENTMLYIMVVWQSSRPANFSPAGLTLWPNRLERWLATLSVLSNPGSNTSGLAGHYIGGSSAGLGEAQGVDSSLRADWLSCFSLAWWEWRVARQGCLVPLRKGGMWQSSRPASFSPAGLTLWPNRLKRWLTTLSVLSNPGSNTSGLAGHYSSKSQFLIFPLNLGSHAKRHIRIDGNVLQNVNEAVHLGHHAGVTKEIVCCYTPYHIFGSVSAYCERTWVAFTRRCNVICS